MVKVTEYKGQACLEVKICPGASRNQISLSGESVRIKVTAHPDKGKANEELREFLAESLHMKKADIVILQGATARTKRLGFACTPAELQHKFSEIL